MEIWKKSFGDPDWYIEFMFKYRFKPEKTLTYLSDGKPVSMLMLLPAKLTNQEIFYVYGVATLPEYRRQGFSSALISYANRSLPESTLGTFLCPATESLFSYYEKQKYESAFYMSEYNATLDELKDVKTSAFEFVDISPRAYKEIRDFSFKGDGYIEWDFDSVEYAVKENELVGGKALLVTCGDEKGLVMYRKWDRKLYVKETTLDGKLLKVTLKKIMEYESTPSCNVRLHPRSSLGGEPKKFAMIYGVSSNLNGYFNLAKD